ncbi:MAG: GGDEF domain-containing protein [Rudaea sp.]
MELLLWRWSTIVQTTSDVMIAGFFVALAFSLGRRELRMWVAAWLMNLGALSVTICFWILQPQTRLAMVVLVSCYVFAKTLFVLLLLMGGAGFAARQPVRIGYGKLCAGVAVFSIAVGTFTKTIDQLGVVQEAVIAIFLALGVVSLFRCGIRNNGWLATGFAIRSLLAIASSAAYALQWANGATAGSSILSVFLAAHSSFDTGAEWVIALGCVLTLYGTIQRELTQSNNELRTAQDEMRQLLIRDQLTGVFNRRSLPTMLREAQTTGATILFFDLDDFKKINDQHGHHAGDACLVRFARALQENFRSGDRVIRYAGDEFVVVAQDMEAAEIAQRIHAVRQNLAPQAPDVQPINFSVGSAALPVDGDPESVLRKADEAMYGAKATRRAGSTS